MTFISNLDREIIGGRIERMNRLIASGIPALAAALREAWAERDAIRAQKDIAYYERNQVVAALAKLFPAGVKQTDIPGWDKEWHGCVYIDLPSGQVSWHFHDSQSGLFAGLPPYQGEWDGHETPEKYKRLAALKP